MRFWKKIFLDIFFSAPELRLLSRRTERNRSVVEVSKGGCAKASPFLRRNELCQNKRLLAFQPVRPLLLERFPVFDGLCECDFVGVLQFFADGDSLGYNGDLYARSL